MIKRIKNLSAKEKSGLALIIFLLVVTIVGGIYLPAKEKNTEQSVDQMKESLADTVWTRETTEGEKGVLFTNLGSAFIGTFNEETGYLLKDAAWLSYDVPRGDTVYFDSDTESIYEGDYEISIHNNKLTLGDETFVKRNENVFSKWYDYMNDPGYIEGFPKDAIPGAEAGEESGE